jgi:hypothetical protein
MGVKEFFKKRSLRVPDGQITRAAELTVRQSIWPITLVTTLFFLWGFSYGLLDTLNKHFQNVLGITQARSAGLQAAYFGFVLSSRRVARAHRPRLTMLQTVLTRLPPLAMLHGFYDTLAIAPASSGVFSSMHWGP